MVTQRCFKGAMQDFHIIKNSACEALVVFSSSGRECDVMLSLSVDIHLFLVSVYKDG